MFDESKQSVAYLLAALRITVQNSFKERECINLARNVSSDLFLRPDYDSKPSQDVVFLEKLLSENELELTDDKIRITRKGCDVLAILLREEFVPYLNTQEGCSDRRRELLKAQLKEITSLIIDFRAA